MAKDYIVLTPIKTGTSKRGEFAVQPVNSRITLEDEEATPLLDIKAIREADPAAAGE
ncbi:MAG: hypothetical protein GAK35_03388 [Herbaspirillum frisingense]|uniref:Uncharacterized protein n=1 Tax=Herbaspirillum frisingense TaxID=92645 RepID=A0A7V8JT69_9BURK|nr:MAG: hypothetical protein GAK35_03388 [Herbaspirillum frisingense]